MAEIKRSLEQVHSALDIVPDDTNPADRFRDVVQPFYQRAAPLFSDLNDMYERMIKLYGDAARYGGGGGGGGYAAGSCTSVARPDSWQPHSYFGENPKDITMEEFFGIFATFASEFEAAVKENAKRREQSEREAKRAREMAQKEQRQREQLKRRESASLFAEGDQKGVMDELIASLRSGNAFGRCVRPVGRRRGRGAVTLTMPCVDAAIETCGRPFATRPPVVASDGACVDVRPVRASPTRLGRRLPECASLSVSLDVRVPAG